MISFPGVLFSFLICFVLALSVEADTHRTDLPEKIDALIDKLNGRDMTARREAADELLKLRDPRATKGLVVTLRSSDPIVRKYAVWILGEIGDVRSIEALCQAMGDSDKSVSSAAKYALMSFGKAAESCLLRLLDDKNPRVGWRAAELLGLTGNRAGVKNLFEAVEKGSPKERIEALKVLSMLDERKALVPLINALVDREQDVRKNAPKHLSNWMGRDPSIVPDLLRSLRESKDPVLRIELIGVLQKAKAPQVTSVMADLSGDADARIRRAAIAALGSTGRKEFLPIVIRATKDKDIEVRKSAASALGEIGGEEAVEPLVRLLRDDVAGTGPYAAAALARIGPKAAPRILPLLTNRDERIRSAAARILGDIRSPAVFQELANLVKDKNPDVRAASLAALGRLGDKRACPLLIEALKDSHLRVREAAHFGLVDLGDKAVMPLIEAVKGNESGLEVEEISQILSQIGPPAVKPLEELWHTGGTGSRLLALNSIGQMGGVKGLKIVKSALGADEEVKLRIEAARLLSKFGEAAINPLLMALKDTDPTVRKTAVESLGTLDDPRSVKSLVDMLGRNTSEVRQSVLKALGQIGGREALKAILSSFGDSDDRVRSAAAEAFGDVFGQIGDEKAVPHLMKLLSDGNSEVRLAAVKALAKIKEPSSSEPIIALLSSKDVTMRRASVAALGDVGDMAAVRPLINSLKDTDRTTRENALLSLSYVLQRIKTAPALTENEIQSLTDLLGSPEEHTRIRACSVLGLAGPQSVPKLVQVVKSGEKTTRIAAISVLGDIRDKQVTPFLLELLNSDPDKDIQKAVLVPLGKIGDRKAVTPLIKRLRSEDPAMRAGAAYALGRIGDVKAVAALMPMLDDADEKVRKSVGEALEKLTGDKCPILAALSPLESFYPYIFVIMMAIVVVPTARKMVKPFDRLMQSDNSVFGLFRKERVQWWLAFWSGIIALGFFVYCTFIEITESSINKGGDDLYSNFFLFTLRTFPFFVGGCLVSGLIMKYFSRKNVFPRSMAGTITLGSLLPLCSCGVVPLTRAMLTIKVPKRAVIAFLIVAPVLNPFVLVLSYGVIGFEYMMLRIVAVCILAVAAGLLIERFIPSEEIQESSPICKLCKSCASPAAGGASSSGLITGWRLMLYLNRYIIIGLLMGAVIATYVPVIIISKYLSSNILGLLFAVTVGVPIFLCSGEEIVMLKPLLDMGLPMGHAVAFTIAANGICVSSIAVLLGVLGRKTTIFLTLSFWVGAFALGYLINMMV